MTLSDRLRLAAVNWYLGSDSQQRNELTELLQEAAAALSPEPAPGVEAANRAIAAVERLERREAGLSPEPGVFSDMETGLMAQSTARLQHIWKLEAALQSIAANTCCGSCQEAALVARAALTKEP